MVEFYDPIAKQQIKISIEPKLLEIWDKIRGGKLIQKNEDRIYLVDGRERTGKSSFAIQNGKYLDPNLDVSRVCVTPEDFLYQIKHAPKGSVVIFDEAFRGLSSKSTRSKVNKAIVEALMECGQRNLIVFIVLPTLFLLEIYAAVFRSEALFHVYKTKDGRRAYKIYNYNNKKTLYLRGKTKHFSYSYPKIKRMKGRFRIDKNEKYDSGLPYPTFDMEGYIEKKAKAFRNVKEKEEEKDKYHIQRDLMIKAIYKDFIKSYRSLSKWLKENNVELDFTSVGKIVAV